MAVVVGGGGCMTSERGNEKKLPSLPASKRVREQSDFKRTHATPGWVQAAQETPPNEAHYYRLNTRREREKNENLSAKIMSEEVEH